MSLMLLTFHNDFKNSFPQAYFPLLSSETPTGVVKIIINPTLFTVRRINFFSSINVKND
jgi:hypothetical protein